MTQDEWLEKGIEEGWCSPPVCETHDGAPMTFDEESEFADGYDPCVPIVRLWAPDDSRA
jgi:hypothetical protein